MSVGRQLCKRLIDAAEDLRRYAVLLEDWPEGLEARQLGIVLRVLAADCESKVPCILEFEGEHLLALPPARFESYAPPAAGAES